MSLIISNYSELITLHRALVEAKFNKNPNDRDVPRSPAIAALAERVIGEIIDHLKSSGKNTEVEKWRQWLRLDETRKQWEIVEHYIMESKFWHELSYEKKLKHVQLLISPFRICDRQLRALLRFGDEYHQS